MNTAFYIAVVVVAYWFTSNKKRKVWCAFDHPDSCHNQRTCRFCFDFSYSEA